jgi:hypothetical protein
MGSAEPSGPNTNVLFTFDLEFADATVAGDVALPRTRLKPTVRQLNLN